MTDKRDKWLVFYLIDKRNIKNLNYDPTKRYVWFEYYVDKDVATREELQDFIDNLGNEIVVSYIAETDDSGNMTRNDLNELIDIKKKFINKNNSEMFITANPLNRDRTRQYLDSKDNPSDNHSLRVNKFSNNYKQLNNMKNLRSFSTKAQRIINRNYSDDFNFINLISANDYKDDSDKLFSTELKDLDSIYEINEILNPKLFADCSEVLLDEGLSSIRATNYISTLPNEDKFRSTKKKIINKILSIYRKIYKKYGIEFDAYKCTDLVGEFYDKGMVAYPSDSNNPTNNFNLCMTFISPNLTPRGVLKERIDGYVEGSCTINYKPAFKRDIYVPTRDVLNPLLLNRSINTWYINDIVIITANNLAIDCIVFTNTYDRYYNTFLYHTRIHMSDNIARMKGFNNDVKLYFTEGTRDYIILDAYDNLYNKNTHPSYWNLIDFFNIFSTGSKNIRHSDFIDKNKIFYTTKSTYNKYKNWIDNFLLKMDCINPETYLRFDDVPHIYDDYIKIIYEYKGFQESIELELEPKVDSVFDIHFNKSGKSIGEGGDYLVINSDRRIIFENNISDTYRIIEDLKSK